jgi:hypothetical protein
MDAKWISWTLRCWLRVTFLWECVWLSPVVGGWLHPESVAGDDLVGAGMAAVWGAILIAILTPIISAVAFMISDVVRTTLRPAVASEHESK